MIEKTNNMRLIYSEPNSNWDLYYDTKTGYNYSIAKKEGCVSTHFGDVSYFQHFVNSELKHDKNNENNLTELGHKLFNIKSALRKKLYIYSYRFRGFSLGCQPKGFIYHNDNIGRFGIVAYDRKLTENEIQSYELELYKEV